MKTKMKAKNVLVSFMAVACILLLASTLSATDKDGQIASEGYLSVNDMPVAWAIDGNLDSANNSVSVIAGEMITVKVYFISEVDDTDVTIELELEGEKDDVRVISQPFDIEEGHQYMKTLQIKVPFELNDARSDTLELNVEVDGKDYKSEVSGLTLYVQRPSYNPEVMSITVDSNVDAGETFPVDIVLKNMGYNDLEDLYVTVSIPELGVSKGPTYFGDLAYLEDCDDCDEDDTTSGRLYLEVPYGVQAGSYTLKVEVTNDDTTLSQSKTIFVENAFTETVIVSSTNKNADVNEQTEFTMLIVNPTDQLKVYKILTESSGNLDSSASDALVAVPAGSSETVRILASADEAGEYTFSVSVFEGNALVDTVAFSLDVEEDDSKSFTADPIVVLTIVLAVVFLVLLVVLIVLIGKKPSKSEEFGESYY